MKNVSKEKGWVIVNEYGNIYDFTYARLRIESIQKWISLWDNPNDWRGHRRKGVKCVKASRIIHINKNNLN